MMRESIAIRAVKGANLELRGDIFLLHVNLFDKPQQSTLRSLVGSAGRYVDPGTMGRAQTKTPAVWSLSRIVDGGRRTV